MDANKPVYLQVARAMGTLFGAAFCAILAVAVIVGSFAVMALAVGVMVRVFRWAAGI